MYSNSGSNRVQVDSSFKPKGVRIQFDPVTFLEIKKTDILFRLTKEMGVTSDEAETKFNYIVEIINHLRPLRSCKLQTFDYLEETIRLMTYTLRSITLFFMMPAISGKIAWNHAWNCLAYYASRDLINPVKSINISEYLILEAIEQENEEEKSEISTSKTQSKEGQMKINHFNNYEIDKILSDIRNSENKFWKGLPMTEVVKHFTIMTTRKNKNGKTYLTVDQLISFLKKGFLNDTTQPKQKINCAASEKGFVISRFYQLYDLACAQYSYPARKAKFISLFTDCFDNWDSNTIKSFFKPNKIKENW